jgi:hypothetical protein
MKNMKRLVMLMVVVGVLGTATFAYAATTKTPAEIAAALTGKTITEVNQLRTTGKTYGTIAKDAGKLDQFKSEILVQKKAVLDQRVADKTITQAKADEIYTAIKNNQATCDGTGTAKIGSKNGVGFGKGSGMGNGTCTGTGTPANGGAARGGRMGAGRGMNR